MRTILQLYKNAYGGLSTPAWMLAFIMFINRSGSMVVPFMSVYLTGHLHLSVTQAGNIMSAFGLGSMLGSFAGGWLSDRIGHFRIQFTSLVLGGTLFFLFLLITNYHALLIAVFVLSTVTDLLRPANAASVASYARPENVTRAFSLNRMALNLGFSIGPAIGGFLAAVSYKLLFMADGITCIVAGLIFFFYFRKRKGNVAAHEKTTVEKQRPVHKDLFFMLFVLCTMGYGTIFFQLLFTLPIYYRDVYRMPESSIGWLLALNGAIVFCAEMLVVYLVGNRIRPGKLIIAGCLLAGAAFLMLNASPGFLILYISMIVLSFSEILAMPFMATLTVQRAHASTRGAYLGWYTFAYSAAFVIAPFCGTRIIDAYGYETLWYCLAAASVLVSVAVFFVTRRLQADHAPART